MGDHELRTDLHGSLEAPSIPGPEDFGLQGIKVDVIPRDAYFREVGIADIRWTDAVLNDIGGKFLAVEIGAQIEVELEGVFVPCIGLVHVRDDVLVLREHKHVDIIFVGGQ